MSLAYVVSDTSMIRAMSDGAGGPRGEVPVRAAHDRDVGLWFPEPAELDGLLLADRPLVLGQHLSRLPAEVRDRVVVPRAGRHHGQDPVQQLDLLVAEEIGGAHLVELAGR